MDPNETEGMLARLAEYGATGTSTAPFYDEWSATYEHDLLHQYGYTAHLIATAAFAEVCTDRSSSIIDLGCGTGLVGVELARLGYALIDGLDLSDKMLAVARTKAIYRRLLTGDLTARTSVADGEYHAAICVGSFAPGHLGPESIAEIARCVRPGGPIVIFMNGAYFVEDGYQQHIDGLVDRGMWHVDSITTHNYMSSLDRPGRLIVAHR